MFKWAKTHKNNIQPQPNLDILIKMGYRKSKIQLVGPDKSPETVNEVELADSILLKKPEAILVKAITDCNQAQLDKNATTTTLKSPIPLPPPTPSSSFISQQKDQEAPKKPLNKSCKFSQRNLMPKGFFNELQSKIDIRRAQTDSVEVAEKPLSEKCMF